MKSIKHSRLELTMGRLFFNLRRFVFNPDFLVMRPIYKDIKKFSEKYAKGNLLDIGCGKMQYKKVFCNKIEKYTGLDHPATKKTFNKSEIIKPDIYADATRIPLKDNSIDTIIIVQALEHINEPDKAIKEINRVF